jgi:hypothetical protein
MNEIGKPAPKDAEEFVAQETGGELSNSDDINAEKPEETSEESSEQSAEFQLTPEIEEKVMDKVQDINDYGVPLGKIDAFSDNYKSTHLRSILKYGLLGRVGERGQMHSFEKTIDKWAQDYRSAKSSINHFNIMGRFSEGMEQDESGHFILKEGANWSNNPYMRAGLDYISIGLIFDLQSCIEDAPIDWGEEKELPLGHYAMHGSRSWRQKLGNISPKQAIDTGLVGEAPGYINKDGFPVNNDTNFGFVISKRIAPREFQGLVISASNRDEMRDLISSCTQEIVKIQTETNSEKVESLIPIYDTAGNLLWPQKMSYEEVKQFVAERDAKKQQSSSEESTSEEPPAEPPIQSEELDES